MSEHELIIYVDHSEILGERLDELEVASRELTEFVKSNEPRIIAYNVYLSREENRMTVINIHPDSDSLEFHGKVGGPVFAKFVGLVKLLTIDVYGKPSSVVYEQLQRKAEMLGGESVNVHSLHAGFSRLGVKVK